MTSQIITPKNLIDTITEYEKRGVKAYILSTEMLGDAYAPSKKVNMYRIPVAIDEKFLKISNLSKMLTGLYIVPIENIAILSDIAQEAYEKNLSRD